MLTAAVLAPFVMPYDPNRMDIVHRLTAPSIRHWLGTDDFGRDVLSRMLIGARLSMLAGGLTVAFAIASGTAIGILAGTARRLDDVVMRFADALMAFPDILLAIALMAALGPSLLNVVLALGTVYTPRVARLVRAATLVLRRTQFIEAAEALGAPDLRIIRIHILPNLLSLLIVQATFIFAAAVLTEAAPLLPRRRHPAHHPQLGQHDRRGATIFRPCRMAHPRARRRHPAHRPVFANPRRRPA